MAKNKNIDYSTKVLEVKNLRKYFKVGIGKRKIIVPAVDNISFDVYKRESFGLVGESGCGKTTTGRTIIKLYAPTDGDIYLNGTRISAGFGGNSHLISKAKKIRREKIIEANPLKQEKYLIKNDFQTEVEQYQFDKKQLNEEFLNKKKSLLSPVNEYNDAIFNLKNTYELKLADVKYDFHTKLKAIKKDEYRQLKDEYNLNLKTEKTRFQRKSEGLIESLGLDINERKEQIKALKISHEERIADIKKEYLPRLETLEKSRESKASIKGKIHQLIEENNKEIAQLKYDYETKLSKVEKPNVEAIKNNIAQSKENYQEKINSLKIILDEKRTVYKRKIQEANERAKNNPNAYVIDKAKIEEANLEYQQIKHAELEKIKEKKADTKIKNHAEITSKMQMIFQDPISSLNPRMTVKEIVAEGLTIQGVKDKELIHNKVIETLNLVGLSPEYVSRYPHEFSGGQRQRIGIARALITNPDVIIADEPISALDVSIQAQVINLLEELKEKLGLTILFVAHDLSVVKYFCDRIAVMYAGKIIEIASSEEIFNNPIHPYTKSLLSAIPQPDPDYEKKRKRVEYSFSMHDYRLNKPRMVEIEKDHFVYFNEAEIETYKKGGK